MLHLKRMLDWRIGWLSLTAFDISNLQALPIYLDKLFNQYLAIILSVTFVLAFGEVGALLFVLYKLDLNLWILDQDEFLFSGYSTSNMHKIWTCCRCKFCRACEDFNDYLLSNSLSHWKGKFKGHYFWVAFFWEIWDAFF